MPDQAEFREATDREMATDILKGVAAAFDGSGDPSKRLAALACRAAGRLLDREVTVQPSWQALGTIDYRETQTMVPGDRGLRSALEWCATLGPLKRRLLLKPEHARDLLAMTAHAAHTPETQEG